MRDRLRALIFALALLIGGAAWAQEPRGYIGLELQDISKEEAEKLGWEAPRGARVVRPVVGGPAAAAGLLPEDIVISLDGVEVESMQAFTAGVGAKAAGAQVRLRVLRAGRERTVSVTLGRRPADLAQPAPEKQDLPILMLDPGGHTALIKGLALTRDGKYLVSAGHDKVIRVWDWQAGKTVRAIRGQVGPGPEGKISAMALSTDERWIAVAGDLASIQASNEEAGKIRLYDFLSGKLVALLKGHTNVVFALAFSPDGRQLLSGGSDLTAIIWDVERRTLVHRLHGHSQPVYVVGFAPDGASVATGGTDRTLKLWSAKNGQEIATLAGHKDSVFSLAFSPVDGTIASGSADGEIRLWEGGTGRYLRTIANQFSDVAVLRFSPNGKLLLSSCGQQCRGRHGHVWEVTTGRERVAYLKHDSNIVLAAAMSPDSRLAATGGGNSHGIHVWDLNTGETEKVLAGTGAPRWAASFSADARNVAWGNTWRSHTSKASNPLEFQLRLAAIGQGLGEPERVTAEAASTFLRARTTYSAYALAHRKGGAFSIDEAILDIRRDGQTVVSIERGPTNGYSHRAYTFSPDGQTIISAGDGGWLTAYDLNGTKLGDFVGHDGDIWAVTPSPDGRLLVSGSADQTVRLWNLKTRELIVTLFHGNDGEWVMWTPQGYYTGSPGADKIVGWQINKGPENSADYVGAEQLRQHLNRPDIIEKAIILASAEAAVREAPGTAFKLADLLARPVPRFKIVSPAPGSTERAGRTSVRIAIEAIPDPVRLVRVQVNGRQVGEETPGIGSGGFGAGERALYVPLAKGRNEIRVALTNAIGEKAETLVLTHDGEGDLDQRGVLHILAIGVNDYKGLPSMCGKHGNASCDLRFPGNDAAKFAEVIEKRLGPGHIQTIKRVLVNGGAAKDAPTAGNITDAVDVLRHARETDTIVLFIAGHGLNEGPDYRFLPTNAEWMGSALRGSTVVPWQVLQGAVEAAKGRRLLFVDTCHSGNAYNQRLGNAAYHANIIAYTAARFDQEAIEDAGLGHGLFTYAVVEGLEGKGALAAKRQLSTKDLADYIKGRVGSLAKAANGEQEPQYFKGRDAEDFVLARW